MFWERLCWNNGLKTLCIKIIIKKIKSGKKKNRAASMPPGFVAGFLLLRATKKAERNSGVQKASHNRTVSARPYGAGVPAG
jgi:hypothetical protein